MSYLKHQVVLRRLTAAGNVNSFSVHVMSASGRHLRTFGSEWGPRAWSPDERSVLVARGATLGLLDPADGAVREVGRLSCGTIYDAVRR